MLVWKTHVSRLVLTSLWNKVWLQQTEVSEEITNPLSVGKSFSHQAQLMTCRAHRQTKRSPGPALTPENLAVVWINDSSNCGLKKHLHYSDMAFCHSNTLPWDDLKWKIHKVNHTENNITFNANNETKALSTHSTSTWWAAIPRK